MTQAHRTESLSERANRLRQIQRASKTGPLIVSQEVMQIAADWELHYRKEAGDIECTTWCKKELGWRLDYYHRRNYAIEVLGEAVRRTLSHDVAVWLVTKLPNQQSRDRAKLALMRECKASNGHPLTKPAAERVLRALELIDPAKSKTCKRCEKLEKLLIKHGIDVP